MNKIERLKLKALNYLICQTSPNNKLFSEVRIELLEEIKESLNPKQNPLPYVDSLKEGCGKEVLTSRIGKDDSVNCGDYKESLCGDEPELILCEKCSLKHNKEKDK